MSIAPASRLRRSAILLDFAVRHGGRFGVIGVGRERVRPARAARRSGVVLLVLICLGGCARSDDPTAPQPKKVYKDAFETPLSAVEIEADGGTIVGAFDAWLRLMPNRELTPRFADAYRPVDCTPLRAYFDAKLALDGLDLAGSTLDCREYRNTDLPFENGRWIVEDPATGRLHYRVWKFR